MRLEGAESCSSSDSADQSGKLNCALRQSSVTVAQTKRVSWPADTEKYEEDCLWDAESGDSNVVTVQWWNMSRVKNELKASLSDPLRRHAAGSIKRARDCAAMPAAVVRRKVNEISNRLSMPKFFIEAAAAAESVDAHLDDEASSSDDSNDPEFLELQERACIVEKYEKGPEQDVEEWENPDFELYKVTDRYGFVHKDENAPTALEQAERKRITKDLSREQKWLRMINRWREGKPVDKLRSRVWKGIPEKLRSVVWTYLLDVSRHKRESQTNLYRELLMRARLISKDIKQIDLDINRTYRDHLAFRKRYDVKQQSLFNVLAAYAMYNTEVGYCQGMSQIAALFLMYLDEEDAFWCLHALLLNKRHSMHGFFVPGFPKLIRFQNHYENVLQKYLPRVKKHLDRAGIPPIYLTKWWFGCFLDRVPFSLALRIWDVFLLEGDVVLIAMAYNIMKMHQKSIRKLQIENFMNYVQTTIAQDFGFPDEEVLHSLEECLRKLRGDRMALPPPPGPGDPPESPVKPLGPVLTRSMIDIRLDIAEIQSRHSRANSIAGRSPAVRGRTPPSPTPIRAKLMALEAQKEESEGHSSSAASTIKSIGSQEDARNGLTTPVPVKPAIQQRVVPQPQPQSPTVKSVDSSPHKISSNSSKLDAELGTSQQFVVNKQSSSRNEFNAPSAQHFPPAAEVPRSSGLKKENVRSEQPAFASRYPAAASVVPPNRHSPHEAGAKQLSSIPPNQVRKPKMDDVLEPSRSSRPRNPAVPPEPPVDYDITPSVEAGSTVPFKPVVRSAASPSPPFPSDVYRSDRANAPYKVPERRVASSAQQTNWTNAPRTANSEDVLRNPNSKSSERQTTAKAQRQSIYDNLDEAPTSQTVIQRPSEERYGKPVGYHPVNAGVPSYVTRNEQVPGVSQYRSERYIPIQSSQFSPSIRTAQQPSPSSYGGQQFSPSSRSGQQLNPNNYVGQQFSPRSHSSQQPNSNSRSVQQFSPSIRSTQQPSPSSRGGQPPSSSSRSGQQVETRVIQLPNHVTYVSVGDEERQSVKMGQQTRFPVYSDFHRRNADLDPRLVSERQRGHGNERNYQVSTSTGAVGHFSPGARGEAYQQGTRPKLQGAERRYLPEPEHQVAYRPKVVHSHPYSSNFYDNRSML